MIVHQCTDQWMRILTVAVLIPLQFRQRATGPHPVHQLSGLFRRQPRKHLPIDQRRGLLIAHANARRMEQPHHPIRGHFAKSTARRCFKGRLHLLPPIELRDHAVVQIDHVGPARLARKKVIERHRLLHVHLWNVQPLGNYRHRLVRQAAQRLLDVDQDVHQPRGIPRIAGNDRLDGFLGRRRHELPAPVRRSP